MWGHRAPSVVSKEGNQVLLICEAMPENRRDGKVLPIYHWPIQYWDQRQGKVPSKLCPWGEIFREKKYYSLLSRKIEWIWPEKRHLILPERKSGNSGWLACRTDWEAGDHTGPGSSERKGSRRERIWRQGLGSSNFIYHYSEFWSHLRVWVHHSITN